jgi:DNA-binding NarL/FixJ family response regulator
MARNDAMARSLDEQVEIETIDRRRARLVVIHPHPIVRWALHRIAEGRPDIVQIGEAASLDEAISVSLAVRPDVIIMDASQDSEQAWEVAAQLRTAYPNVGIVILSADGSDQSLFRALQAGASSFVAKSAPVHDVIAAIRGAGIAPSSFAAADLAVALRRSRESSERTALTAREREILFLLHDGLSVPEIAAQLYVSLSTAKTYVARLYDKLGARNRAQAFMAAIRLGLFDNRPHARHAGPKLAIVG